MSIANNEQPRGCRDDAIKILRSKLMQPKQRGRPGKNKNIGGKLHLGD